MFPVASEDLLKVWNEVTKTFKPENIGMVGCSAGGSLITHTTAMLIKEGRATRHMESVTVSSELSRPTGTRIRNG